MRKVFLFFLILSLGFSYQTVNARPPKKDRCANFFEEYTYNISTNPDQIKIAHSSLRISDGTPLNREVRFRLPSGSPPKEGWPVVIIFQGTYNPVEFSRFKSSRFGLFYEVRLIEKLLQLGFAVLAPDAQNRSFWQTNFSHFSLYEKSTDFNFITNLLIAISDNKFGPLNKDNLFATGLSSGGYQTSRMAVSFAGKFKALAIQSASYATCLGETCQIPSKLSANHPPTLMLHGIQDKTVPFETALAYFNTLKKNNVPVDLHSNELAGHQWLPESPDLIGNFFDQMRK